MGVENKNMGGKKRKKEGEKKKIKRKWVVDQVKAH
jgi:hypothetical protein